MKKNFETPELELIRMDSSDVIALSGEPMDGLGPKQGGDYGEVTDFTGGGPGSPLQ